MLKHQGIVTTFITAFLGILGLSKVIKTINAVRKAFLNIGGALQGAKLAEKIFLFSDELSKSGGIAGKAGTALLGLGTKLMAMNGFLRGSTLATVKDTAAKGLNAIANSKLGKVVAIATGKIKAMTVAQKMGTMAALGIVGAIAVLAVYMSKTGTDADKMAKKITDFADKLAAAITAFAAKLPKILPSLIAALEKVITSLIAQIPVLLPVIVDAGVKLFMGLIASIEKIIKPLVKTLPKIVDAIVKALPILIPAIIDAGVTLFSALMKAIPKIIPLLIKAIPQIIKAIVIALASAGAALIKAFGKLFKKSIKAIKKPFKKIGKFFGKVKDTILKPFKKVGEFFQKKWKKASEGLKDIDVKATLTVAKDKAFDDIKEAWDALKDSTVVKTLSALKDKAFEEGRGLWDAIKDGEVFKYLKSKIDAGFEAAKSAWEEIKDSAAVKAVKGFVEKTYEDIKTAWGAIKNSDAVKTIKGTAYKTFTTIKKSWGAIKSKAATIKAYAKNKSPKTFNSLKNAWRTLKSKTVTLTAKVKAKVSSIKSWVNQNVIAKLNKSLSKAKIFGKNPIPYLATGGYVKKNTPQLAMIGDNRHQGEVVAPEDKLMEMVRKAAAMSGGGANPEIIMLLKEILKTLKALDIDVYLDGKPIKKRVVDLINANTKATGVCEIKL